MSHPANVTADENRPRFAILLLACVALLIGADVTLDALAGTELLHLLFEGLIFVVAAGGIALLTKRSTRALATARADAAKWRKESQALLEGLGAAIDKQFAEWNLSAAEREVGLLLLKGLSLKEIAGARGTSERTVRQQSLAVYRKAGVSGRAELSAFFLEDLLLPAR